MMSASYSHSKTNQQKHNYDEYLCRFWLMCPPENEQEGSVAQTLKAVGSQPAAAAQAESNLCSNLSLRTSQHTRRVLGWISLIPVNMCEKANFSQIQ